MFLKVYEVIKITTGFAQEDERLDSCGYINSDKIVYIDINTTSKIEYDQSEPTEFRLISCEGIRPYDNREYRYHNYYVKESDLSKIVNLGE